MSLILLLTLVAVGLAYLVLERLRLDHHRKAIPLMIAVTGTRGKTSVTRTLAAVLRESGRRVLAKTTGSEAVLIMPDGGEREIHRRGRPSIIEQKHIVRLAADRKVDAAVIEIMSIHPENHLVEARRLLKPDLVLATNFRVDHSAALGETRDAVAAALALDVPAGARVFVPADECLPAFRAAVQESGAELIEVPPGTASPERGRFAVNRDLVYAAARSLGIDDEVIRRGVPRGQGDIGALRIWQYQPDMRKIPYFVVNAFAANDPDSTKLVHEEVMAALDLEPGRCAGLLTLRPDRGDRTLQWLEALRGGFIDRFRRLYVLGLHAPALAWRLERFAGRAAVEVLRARCPAEITQRAASGIEEAGGAVFGFGNIVGLGAELVAHWSEAGEPWEVEG